MIRISGVARPGDKGGTRKNREARFTFWAGRAIQTRNVECGMARKDAKNSEFPIPNSEFGNARWARPSCGSTGGSPGEILFPPMLFARAALASGPQVYLCPGKRIAKMKGGREEFHVA
jgi:hypothetical protein